MMKGENVEHSDERVVPVPGKPGMYTIEGAAPKAGDRVSSLAEIRKVLNRPMPSLSDENGKKQTSNGAAKKRG